MGLFSRKRDAQGLYTGDAPVSAPGVDGAAPGAYQGAMWGAGGDPSYQTPPSPGNPSYSAGPSMPLSTDPPTPPGMTPFSTGPVRQPGPAPQAAPGTGLDPATAARIQATLAAGPRRRGGGLFVLIILAAILVPAGFAVYKAVSAATSLTADAKARTSPDGIAGRHVGATPLGQPVSIRTKDAAYDVTVFGAVSQPGDAWGYARAGSDPVLVVDAQISRTDAGTDPVEFTGWNWSVVGTDGKRVIGDIITNYRPDLAGPRLVGGETARGFVTFGTSVTSTSLTVAGEVYGAGLATWQLNATTPKPVTGVVGEGAQAEISRPGFTVTVGNAEVVPDGDARLGHHPTSGQFLVLPVDFTPNDGTSGHLGNVDREAFVFVPDGAPSMFPASGGVKDVFSFVSIDAAATERGALAFDTKATSGTLQLRDGADRPIITWAIDAG
jgi:hypothetical protein